MTSPVAILSSDDPGADTSRRFRYQHAYGVILLISAITRRVDYVALWCEQHEDFLAETPSGVFDVYQIKTRRPEFGAWKLSDEPIYSSIKRFADFYELFPDEVRAFKFVSNTEYFRSTSAKYVKLSPLILIEGIKELVSGNRVAASKLEGLKLLCEKTGLSEGNLVSVLQRIEFIVGPTLRAFEDEISQSHLPYIPSCSGLNSNKLAQIREFLIAKIAEASSLYTERPERHLGYAKQNLLEAKRITPESVRLLINEARSCGARFSSELFSLQLGSTSEKQDILQRKMVHGGLALHYEMMRRRALTAEQQLLDLATRPDSGGECCSQLETVVFGECSDAYLRASQGDEPFGPQMLIDIQDRLKRIAEDNPLAVDRQSYDVLVGIAGMLSAECKIWWSRPFHVDDSQ